MNTRSICNEMGRLLALYFILYKTLLKEEPVPIYHAFKDKYSGFYLKLSPQQQRCLFHLLQGKSAKEVAIAMNISFRTVQHYTDDIRKANHYRSVKQLLACVEAI